MRPSRRTPFAAAVRDDGPRPPLRRPPTARRGDRRQAQTVTVDGSEWWLEPSGCAYRTEWTVFRDGVEIARARLLQVARQTVARAVGAKIGG